VRTEDETHLVGTASSNDVDGLWTALCARIADLLTAPADARHELIVRVEDPNAASGLEVPDPDLVVVRGGEHVLAAGVEDEPADPVIVANLKHRRERVRRQTGRLLHTNVQRQMPRRASHILIVLSREPVATNVIPKASNFAVGPASFWGEVNT
jgi:hypothetical protein